MVYNDGIINERRWSKKNRKSPFPYEDPQAIYAGVKTRLKTNRGFVYVYPPLTTQVVEDLKNMRFKIYRIDGKADPNKYANLDIAFIGDSQLHVAVFGSDFRQFTTELNGLFRGQ